MHIQEVNDEKSAKFFTEMAMDIYKNYPYWVRPLDKDIDTVFNPKRNRYFSHGECTRWILWNDNKSKVIGRVAAFINKRGLKADLPVGGMGFFECIEDEKAAFMLFDTCKKWLEDKGMQAMDGPINFGERNQWWGLLIDGFDRSPVYQMNYNPEYYKKFFEQYGFQVHFYQFSYGLVVQQPRPQKYVDLWPSYSSDPDYEFTWVKKNNLEKYAEDFRTVYNASWGKHDGFKQMTKEQAMKIMNAIKPIMVEHLMQFAYFKGEPIAMYISIPDLNQYFRHINGKLDWIGKLKTLWYKSTMKWQRFVGIVFGVVPEFQGKGIEGMMVMNLHHHIKDKNWWREIELTWIGDFNPKMMRVAENLGADIVKRHATYRYLFDRNRPFERAPIIH